MATNSSPDQRAGSAPAGHEEVMNASRYHLMILPAGIQREEHHIRGEVGGWAARAEVEGDGTGRLHLKGSWWGAHEQARQADNGQGRSARARPRATLAAVEKRKPRTTAPAGSSTATTR
jgi:hypothetical protein